MVQVHSPIGEYIMMSREDREQGVGPALKSKFDELVEQVRSHIVLDEESQLPDSLLENLFALRLEMAEVLRSDESLFEKMERRMVKEATVNYQVQGKLAKLAKTTAEVFEVYGEIFSSLRKQLTRPNYNMPRIDLSQKPTLQGLYNLCLLQPNPELEHYLEWVKASLFFEFYLVASDLGLSSKLPLSNNDADLLARKMRRAFEDFAAHSAISELWEPGLEDERQLIRNIKIVIAIIKTEMGIGITPVEPADLYDILHNPQS